MKLNHPVLKKHQPKAHRVLDRRYAERAPIRCRISYFGTEGTRIVRREGSLKDLSRTGCKIVGGTTSSLGSSLTLLLDLENGQVPICLTNVIVSWNARDSFAVKFPKLPAEERKRLQEVIWKNVSVASLDNRRTAFRFV